MVNSTVYLDNNATTQVDERVLAEMLPFFKHYYGNPSSKYYPQAEIAKKAVETSRIQCAKLIGAKPQEIIFIEKVEKAISSNIILVTIMFANNELGTINPIDKISEVCKKKIVGKIRKNCAKFYKKRERQIKRIFFNF